MVTPQHCWAQQQKAVKSHVPQGLASHPGADPHPNLLSLVTGGPGGNPRQGLAV